MANKKFSEFDLKTNSSDVAFVVGFNGSDNVRIAPSNLSSGGASDLNGLTDCLANATNNFVGNVPPSVSSAIQNTSLGIDALETITSGSFNVGIGFAACKPTTGSKNTGVGRSALGNLDTNSGSTAVGYQAGFISTGGDSVYVGNEPGRANTATGHISIGYKAGYSNTSGEYNTNLGYQAGYSNTTNANRTVIGYQAGYFSTGAFNTFLGYKVAYGSSGNTTGERNVAIGDVALTALQSGGRNVAIGTNCGQAITSGSQNVVIGDFAGSSLTTGADNIILGQNAQASAVDVSNEITLGASNITALRCQIQTIAALSDSRDKTNIQASTYGLDFINKLNPVTFDWNMRDGAKVGDKDLGFIAQELQEVDDENLQLVYANNPDRLEASYGRLIPVLVQAIKELKAEIELLKS